MAIPETLHLLEEGFLSSPLFESSQVTDCGNARAMSIEKKIELLETLAGKVSNRRARRLINDRLLMELVPRLNAGEIRGLFAPPPWGDPVLPSPFQMAYVAEWDRFRNIDMDKEAKIIDNFKSQSAKVQTTADEGKIAALKAWRRIDSRTRDALRRCSLTELIESYEVTVRAFIEKDKELLIMKVEDSFHRLLLHGVCEFYNLASVSVYESEGGECAKLTKIKKKGDVSLPSVALSDFLKMCKRGRW